MCLDDELCPICGYDAEDCVCGKEVEEDEDLYIEDDEDN